MRRRLTRWLYIALTLFAGTAVADPGSRIVATGGATMIEGAAGGGIVPWALISGYGDRSELGGTAWLTRVSPEDYTLDAMGAAVGIGNRLELSVSRQRFDIDAIVPGEDLEQTILGAKYRVAGELLYSSLPQIALGIQYKQHDAFDVPKAVGARDDSGVDLYAAASKVWLDGPFHRSAFLNGTLRATRANQTGLLGFGGDRRDDHSLVVEASAGLFLDRHWVLGAEYRQKPNHLSFADEDDWYDVFVGWFPSKRVSVVAAWSDLGSIAGLDEQRGLYLSLQISQ